MLNVSTIDNTNIVTADYSGSLDVDDERRLHEALGRAREQHGVIRLLASVGDVDLGRIEPKAAWMDLKASDYLRDVDRLAVVSDASWLTSVSDWFGKSTSVDVRTYSSTQRDEAIAWLSE